VITAVGRAKFRPFTKTKELEGRGSAMADAVAKWQRAAAARFGESYKLWGAARDTKFTCAPTKSGKIIGTSFIGCTISGRPCAVSGAAKGAAAAAGSDRGGKGARAHEPAKRGAPERPDPASLAYQREMEHQERLAEQRRKAESDAYAREMARQNQMAEERRRQEAKGRERLRDR
jgi:hypothetical protein